MDRIDRARQGVGIVVGVIEPKGRRVVAYGSLDQGDARPLDGDTIFEIGAVTEVFTSLLLADMVKRGEVALDDPVAKYLPQGVKVPERGGRRITLQDLSTHTSGLPRIPSNLKPANPANPYADYSVERLYEFLSAYKLSHDIGTGFDYSNLGGGLLGHALARRAGMNYETLVRSRVADPLGMSSTRITLSTSMKARLAVGHNAKLAAVPNWDFQALAGAAALRSTANDLLVFLAANLGYSQSPLAPAMAAMREVRRPTTAPDVEMALGWAVTGDGITWANGSTAGYRSFVGYHPKSRVGVVALSNTFTDTGLVDIGMYLLGAPNPLANPPKAPAPETPGQPQHGPDVPYVRSSNAVVDGMLKLARTQKSDIVYDLGCGDGRIVIAAAKDYGARGVGVDISPELIQEARENARKAHVEALAKFEENDLFDADIHNATVVALYLLPSVNLRLRPKLLRELKPGARVVSHNWDMGDWKPDKQETVDGRTIYLWIVPEKK